MITAVVWFLIVALLGACAVYLLFGGVDEVEEALVFLCAAGFVFLLAGFFKLL